MAPSSDLSRPIYLSIYLYFNRSIPLSLHPSPPPSIPPSLPPSLHPSFPLPRTLPTCLPPSLISPLSVYPQVDQQPEVKDFMTIDWTYYTEKDRDTFKKADKTYAHRSAAVRFLLDVYDATQSWLALGLIGLLSGMTASIVSMGTDWANDLKFGTCTGRGFWITRAMCCKDSADLLLCPNWRSWGEIVGGTAPESIQLWSYFSYVVIAMLQAGYAAWLCKTFAPYAVGSGIGEIKVIMSGFVIKRFLGAWTLIIKSLGLILSVGSGMAIGKEGPFIHLTCCIANVASRLFSKYSTNESKKRELLCSAAAAGIAVAFGAPIGGVLFSLEEVGDLLPAKTMWRSLFCAVWAAMTLQRMNPLNQSGKLVLFEVGPVRPITRLPLAAARLPSFHLPPLCIPLPPYDQLPPYDELLCAVIFSPLYPLVTLNGTLVTLDGPGDIPPQVEAL